MYLAQQENPEQIKNMEDADTEKEREAGIIVQRDNERISEIVKKKDFKKRVIKKNTEKASNVISNKPQNVNFQEAEIIDLDDNEEENTASSTEKIIKIPEPDNKSKRSASEVVGLQNKPKRRRSQREKTQETETVQEQRLDEEEGNAEKEKKNTTMVDNQVQCVNLHCQSGYNLGEAPVFVLTHFGVERRKNVLQKVCQECFEIALKHVEQMKNMLLNDIPLLSAEFPCQKDDVVVMDPIEEICEEKVLPSSVISLVENELVDVMKEVIEKYDIDYQIAKSQEILTKKYEDLAEGNKQINRELAMIENQLKEARTLIYKKFTPKIKSLPALSLYDPAEQIHSVSSTSPTTPKSRAVATKRTTQTAPAAKTPSKATKTESQGDVVAVKEVEVPQANIPPVGTLVHPKLVVGYPVYAMKVSFFGVWVRAKVVEVMSRTAESPTTYRIRFDSSYHGTQKVVNGKQLAYAKPSTVRYPVGTRVIALFHNSDSPGKDAYYSGVIAEPPKILNSFRYLVFFDDGYAQYVHHSKILLVCESSRHVYEDIHPESREFIKTYLDQYPERPMVKLQKGQIVKTEWNGKWWTARVMAIDGSLAQMFFDADRRTEWIYRGSTRLGPLFSELIAAAARKEQGALSRHRTMGIASLKKKNMPYVEYSVDQDDSKSQPTLSKNVAKKSTTSKPNSQETSEETQNGPPKPNEKIECTSKGYIRRISLDNRLESKNFTPHQCGVSCIEWTKYSRDNCKGVNPLAIPHIYGFERQIVRVRGNKKYIMYRAPCGKRIRNIAEMHRYLRITKSEMGLDLFDFDRSVRPFDEFHLESNMYCTHIKDISCGHENVPVSCVNELCHDRPSFMNYSTSRIPQEGVNINLDQEFLVCCSCTDDCQDKEKCECWQLTLEGTIGANGKPDYSIGYQYKRLQEPVITGIYECNQRCKCGPTCLNRVAQFPLQLNLQVFKTLKKGWGLRTLNDIPKGGFICIYAGRLHTEQSANDDGRMYGDEYLAELDYIEVAERYKEGYESEVIESETGNNSKGKEDSEDEGGEQDELDDGQISGDDQDYVPSGFGKQINESINNVVNTRGRNKKLNPDEKSESEGEKEKEEDSHPESEPIKSTPYVNTETDAELEPECTGDNTKEDDEDEEMKKKPSKFTAALSVNEDKTPKHKSVREMFGDGADDCYIMDAKSSGNIGRYLNHSCQPNVFVQNVFVDTHDVRFPWVAFFALSHIKAGSELTWDYNYDVGSVPGKVLYCYCNSAECRGRLL